MAITINTPAAFLKYGHTLTAHCDACHHSAVVDLDALGAKIGMDTAITGPDVRLPIRCGKCRSNRISYTVTPDKASGRGGGGY